MIRQADNAVSSHARSVLALVIALGVLPFFSCASERSGSDERYAEETIGKVTNRATNVDTVKRVDSSDTSENPGIGAGDIRLSTYEYIVEPEVESAAFRLYVINETTTLSMIDNVDPSCGCILTTVQRRQAKPGDSAEIYVALMPEQMSRTQPYTVDVTMTSDPSVPLRMKIWHREAYNHAFPDDE